MYDKKISVIIPLAPNEKLNERLEQQLNAFPTEWEILICSAQAPKTSETSQASQISQTSRTSQIPQTPQTSQISQTSQTSQTSQISQVSQASQTSQMSQVSQTSQASQISQTTHSAHGLSVLEHRVKWIVAENGRANCLNEGAKHATGDYLWFLHADSMLFDNTVNKLNETMKNHITALYYFDLQFFTTTCPFMRFNERGVLIRSRCLKTPFGDQAFFIKRELFESLPKYSTEVAYGEDHILVRDYRRYQIPILPIGMKILTSARKYEENGWLKTNLLHLYLWRKQAHEDSVNYKKHNSHGKKFKMNSIENSF